MQDERKRRNKQKIKSWDKMIAKLRGKFLPKDYQLTLFRQMQNLRQRLMSVRGYTKEFYKLNIRAGYVEEFIEKTTIYINGLRLDIQDEINVLSPRTIKEAYQLTLKAEEKLTRKQSGRGKSSTRGRGQQSNRGRSTTQKEGASSQSPQ